MWVLFSVLCMAVLTAADIVGKKAVEADGLAPLKLRISVMATSAVLGIVMFLLKAGESGLAPWVLLREQPLIAAVVLCFVFSEFLYNFSLRYVGMSIMEAVSSLEGVIIFSGMLIINLASGGLGAIRDMLIPERLVLILFIIAFTVLLPIIDAIAERKKGVPEDAFRVKRGMAMGVLIALVAAVLGCGDSLIADFLLDAKEIGAVDLAMTTYFSMVFPLPFFCIALFKKSGRAGLSGAIASRYSILYSVLFVTQLFLGVLAAAFDAVRTEIMYLSYPVISILGARCVLKERYSAGQSVCIWVITISAILFCVVDRLL